MEKQFELSLGSVLSFNLTEETNRFLEVYAERVIYERFLNITVFKAQEKYLMYLRKNMPGYSSLTLDEIARRLSEDKSDPTHKKITRESYAEIDRTTTTLIPFVTFENAMLVFTPATGMLFRWAFLAFICQHPVYVNIMDEDSKDTLSMFLKQASKYDLRASNFEKSLESYFPDSVGMPRDALRPDESDSFPHSPNTLRALARLGKTIQNMQDEYFKFVIEEAVPQIRKVIERMRFVHAERLTPESYLDADFFVTPSYRQELNAGVKEDSEGGLFKCLYPQKEVW